MLVFEDRNSIEQPRRERSGADTVVVAVDLKDAEAGRIEAGSGIKSTFPRAAFSTTCTSLECEGGNCGRRCDSDSGGVNNVDTADNTGEVDGRELEERRDTCSRVDTDVNGATAPRDISSPRGERETCRCHTLVVGVGGLERGESGMGSAMNGDNDSIEQLVEEKQNRVFAHAPVSELSARGSSPTLRSTPS